MKLNIQKILQLASNLTGADPQRLNDAAQKASQYGGAGIGNRHDALNALRNAGVDQSFLGKVQGLLSNPLARTLAGAAGMDIADVSHAIDELKTGEGASPSSNAPSPSSDSRLSSLRRGLEKAKKRF